MQPSQVPIETSSLLADLRGVGPKRSRVLEEGGYLTAADLLSHLPNKYEDRRVETTITAIETAGAYLLRGTLSKLSRIRIRRRGLTLVRGLLTDSSGTIPILWFNRPYLLNQVDEETEYLLYGRVREGKSGLEIFNPTCEASGSERLSGRIVPQYGPIGSLSAAFVRSLIEQILDRFDPDSIADPIPQRLLDRHDLPRLSDALVKLHVPDNTDDVQGLNNRSTVWHQRLAYGEFFELQMQLCLLRDLELFSPKPHSYCLDDGVRSRIFDFLPFELTEAQKRTFSEIERDLASVKPMLRLLQGDVGSGKTIVAAMTLVAAIENGLQAAIMAPTEILAEQHYRTFQRLLGDRYRIALMSRSIEQPETIRDELASGQIQLLVGTHALIQKQVEFKNLGVAVIDEQHRFGVAQRKTLQEKGSRPDLLVMTATPIPRSLALTVYGDLALSVIDELPPGRTPVTTRVVSVAKRSEVYERLRNLLSEGAQAYVVVPLIRDNPNLQAESIASGQKILQRHLAGFQIEAFHGATEPMERDRIMRSFLDGDIDVLLATSVIEVGLDVANASVMIIENAERFGLAQLHQLRGRVGRGPRRSYCLAIHGKLTATASRRLEVFSQTDDGFQIAETDLEIRGPGDLLGTRQSGLAKFRMGDILRDRIWLERARTDAWETVESGSDLLIEPEYLNYLRERAKQHFLIMSGG